MDTFALLTTQITDVFRMGLLVGLFFTIQNTKAQTGYVIPIIAGLVFVAAVIASSMPKPGVDFWTALISGLVANAVIFAVIWLVWMAYSKLSAK
jgi:hypothetical protein